MEEDQDTDHYSQTNKAERHVLKPPDTSNEGRMSQRAGQDSVI